MLTLAFLALSFTGSAPVHYSLPTTVEIHADGSAYVDCGPYSAMIDTDRGVICTAD